jgi:hypothetical protein
LKLVLHVFIYCRVYIELDSSQYDDNHLLKECCRHHHQHQLQEQQEQQHLQNHHHKQCSVDQDPQHHPHHQHLRLQEQAYNEAELGAGEVPALPEGGDNLRPRRRQQRQSIEASYPSEGKSAGSHMPIVVMHRYETEALSPTPIDHHHHHHHQPQQHHHHHQHHQQQLSEQHVLARHLEEQQPQRQDEDQEDVHRVSGITAAMRGTRADFNLNVLFPNLPSQNTSSSSGSTNSHHGHHQQQHLEEVLHDDTYLQIRGGTGEVMSPVPVRTGSSPGSSTSPHEDQQQQQQQDLSSPHRQNDSSSTYSSAQETSRLQNFTHLTAMQPAVVSVSHLQDERVQSEQLYIDSIYAHHQQSTSHHQHQEHEQSSNAPHSPAGPRLVFFNLIMI